MAEAPRSGSDEFGEALRSRREALGLSRRDLVAATGLSYPYVSQLETGYRMPSQKSLHRLAQALRVDPSELSASISFDEWPSTPKAFAVAASAAHGHWRANPAFAAESPRQEQPKPGPVARQAAELISSLPVDARLEALAQVQRRVVEALIEERAH